MRVVLIGDSIRMGYEPYVRQELADLADVWGPTDNGGTSRNVLDHLADWVLNDPPDLLHINCGLHDLKRTAASPEPAVALADYEANLRAIFSRLRAAQIATLWATCTPVNQVWHARGSLRRREEDVIAYNRVALRVAQQYGLPINDLYCLITSLGRDLYLSQDGRHFVPAGYALLGRAVADQIRRHLP
ncbi:MAG: SGNH/GDSL hydrolase family protein [Chloroflexi bacterium]|nr:SGNH/GDSL hydrolase family protein [Chloroflexota bacterium]